MKNLLIIYAILLCAAMSAQKLSRTEKRLYHYINIARMLHGKKRLPLNDKLNTVARLHMQNIEDSLPSHKGVSPHSWFADPLNRWKPLVYTKDKDGVYCCRKAREITGYTGNNSSEILVMGKTTCLYAIRAWLKSPGHRDVMLGNWENCGVRIGKYGSVFFGDGY